MTEALQAEQPAGPETDVLEPQAEAPKATGTQPSLDDDIEKAIAEAEAQDKARQKPKPEPKPKAEKPEAKPDAEDDAPDPEDDTPDQPKDADKPADGDKPGEQPKKPTSFKDAPQRFDEAARKEWEATPEGVRGAIHRVVRETEQGVEKYKPAAERYDSTFREFDDIAKQHGADPKQALQTYLRLDQRLRGDLIGGLAEIVETQGLRGQNGQLITLRDVAASIMGQTPDQSASRQDSTIAQLRQQNDALAQQVAEIQRFTGEQQQSAHRATIQSTWEGFVAQNPRAATLEEPMAEFLTRYPAPDIAPQERLADAYAYASAKHPDPTAAHTGTEPPLPQTQPRESNPAGQKSVTGAPRGDIQKHQPQRSLDEDIAKALSDLGIG